MLDQIARPDEAVRTDLVPAYDREMPVKVSNIILELFGDALQTDAKVGHWEAAAAKDLITRLNRDGFYIAQVPFEDDEEG